MSRIQDILADKSPVVQVVSPSSTVLDAARKMHENRIGCLVVVDRQVVVGIISERDMLEKIIVAQRDPQATFVEDIMTQNVVCGRPETSIEEAQSVFKNRRIRHLPIVDDYGHLQGLISIGDINAAQAYAAEQTIHFLNEYLHGRT